MTLTSRSPRWVMMVQHKTSDQYLPRCKVSTWSIHNFKRYRLIKTLTKNFNILSNADADANATSCPTSRVSCASFSLWTRTTLRFSLSSRLSFNRFRVRSNGRYLGTWVTGSRSWEKFRPPCMERERLILGEMVPKSSELNNCERLWSFRVWLKMRFRIHPY